MGSHVTRVAFICISATGVTVVVTDVGFCVGFDFVEGETNTHTRVGALGDSTTDAIAPQRQLCLDVGILLDGDLGLTADRGQRSLIKLVVRGHGIGRNAVSGTACSRHRQQPVLVLCDHRQGLGFHFGLISNAGNRRIFAIHQAECAPDRQTGGTTLRCRTTSHVQGLHVVLGFDEHRRRRCMRDIDLIKHINLAVRRSVLTGFTGVLVDDPDFFVQTVRRCAQHQMLDVGVEIHLFGVVSPVAIGRDGGAQLGPIVHPGDSVVGIERQADSARCGQIFCSRTGCHAGIEAFEERI